MPYENCFLLSASSRSRSLPMSSLLFHSLPLHSSLPSTRHSHFPLLPFPSRLLSHPISFSTPPTLLSPSLEYTTRSFIPSPPLLYLSLSSSNFSLLFLLSSPLVPVHSSLLLWFSHATLTLSPLFHLFILTCYSFIYPDSLCLHIHSLFFTTTTPEVYLCGWKYPMLN